MFNIQKVGGGWAKIRQICGGNRSKKIPHALRREGKV
jgi:hypothetical protein